MDHPLAFQWFRKSRVNCGPHFATLKSPLSPDCTRMEQKTSEAPAGGIELLPFLCYRTESRTPEKCMFAGGIVALRMRTEAQIIGPQTFLTIRSLTTTSGERLDSRDSRTRKEKKKRMRTDEWRNACSLVSTKFRWSLTWMTLWEGTVDERTVRRWFAIIWQLETLNVSKWMEIREKSFWYQKRGRTLAMSCIG